VNEQAMAIGVFVLAGTQLLQFVLLFRKFSGAPEKREIANQALAVSPSASWAVDQKIRDMDRCLNERTEALRREIKADISQVYERIEDKVTGLTSRMTDISVALGELRGEIKRLANGGKAHG
jgi:hypothetical protein